MNEASTQASANDRKGLKYDFLSYICRDQVNGMIKPTLAKAGGKSVRGFSHPMTARLLCPQKLLAKFDEDPTYVASIFFFVTALTSITAHQVPKTAA